MKISALSDATGVPIATLKFYLREGLLHPGVSLSRTQASYDQTHTERVRLVRALSDFAGLSLASVGRVLKALDESDPQLDDVVAISQQAVIGCQLIGGECRADDATPEVSPRVAELLEQRDWEVDLSHPAVADLERAWQALDDSGLTLSQQSVDGYIDAVEQMARIDVDTLPAHDGKAAVRQLVLSSVLLRQFFRPLRMLAQLHTASELLEAEDAKSA